MPKALLKILKNGLLPILLGCGLFFINIRPYHDWGDDFAQYLQQARNLEEGNPLASGPHVRNPEFVLLGPEVYPPGFPILLTISNSLFKNEIIGAQYMVTTFLLLFGWVSFLLFIRGDLPWLLSLAIMLTFLYHPWILSHKSEVLSEFPFAFFFMLAILFADKGRDRKRMLAAGFFAGIAITIRSAGWVLPVAGIALAAYSFFTDKKAFKNYVWFTAIAIGIALSINFLSGFYAASNGYAPAFTMLTEGLWANFIAHLNDYAENVQVFIEVEATQWHALILLLQAFFWVGLVLGVLKFQQYPFLKIVLIAYLLLIFVFPFSAGFRFLIPIVPLLLFISFRGLMGRFQLPAYVLALAGLAVLNISYQKHRKYIISQQEKQQPGPQMPESQELFGYVSQHLDANDLIIFSKPRALAYYTQKPSSATLWEIDQNEFERQVKALGANYFLYYREIDYLALNEFVRRKKDQLEPVFSNEKFVLYKRGD